MRKRVLIFFVTVLSLTLAACGGKSEKKPGLSHAELGYQWQDPTKPIVKAKGLIEFEILAPKNSLADDYNDMLIFKTLYDLTNVDVKWRNITETAYAEKKGLIMADKKNLPDAIYHAGFSEKEIILYASRKQIIAIDDYLDYMPYFKKILEERPDIERIVRSADGKIYSLPRIEEMGLLPYPNLLFLNKEWTKKLIEWGVITFLEEEDLVDGLSLTLDQFREILRGFKTHDMNGNGDKNDEIPLSFVYQNWQGNQSDLYAAFGVPENVDHLTLIDGKVTSTVLMDGWKEATRYFHEWVKEGLIDKEAFSQSQDYFLAKGKATYQKLGAFYWWESETVVKNPEDYIVLNPLIGPNGHQMIGVANNPEVSTGNFVVLSKCQNPEILLTYMDRFYDPMISAQINYGPIGVVYEEELDENGMLVQKPIPEGMTADELRLKNAPLGIIYLSYYHWEHVVHMEPRAKLRLARLEKHAKPFVPQSVAPIPPLSFTLQEINTLSRVEQNISDYIYQMQTQWLLNGGLTDKTYEEFKETLREIGLEEALKVYQAAYDRM